MSRHIILSLGRSGSNTLADLVNQHPHALNVGEVLGPWTKMRRMRERFRLYPGHDAAYLDAVTRPSPLLFAANIFRSIGRMAARKPGEIKILSRIRTFGFKDFATLIHENGLEDWLRESSDVKVVGLVRDDIIDRLVSWKTLETTGAVSSRDFSKSGSRSISIDAGEILNLLEAIDGENRLLKEMLSKLPEHRVLVIRYEDFYRSEHSRQDIMVQLFEFLGIEPMAVHSDMKKIISGPSVERISNREECAEALRGTSFEGLLD